MNAHRRARRLTATHELVGNALVRRLGVDGQLDPSHDTIAGEVGCCARTVRRALEALKALGLVLWQRRLVRDGWRVEQTSNAYILVPAGQGTSPAAPTQRCGGQSVPQTKRIENHPVLQPSPVAVAAAQEALAQRRRAIEARLLTKGLC